MEPLVTTDWLANEMAASDLRIVDASRHLADTGRDAAAEYVAGHIPGAVFMDLAELVDLTAPVDNTLPPAEKFASRMQALGLGDGSRIVLYDDSAIRSSARAWFMLRMFGASNVAILDGGLAKWRAEGRELESGRRTLRHRHFTVWRDPAQTRDKDAVLANIETGREQLIDARAVPRFTGEAADPRPGIASGHIPGSRNLVYTDLYNAEGTFRSKAEIRALFEAAGIDLARPVITSCNSGVTACVLAFALHLVGKNDVALYDGSWTEWGGDPMLPKATGKAAAVA